ncbi:hypothetical protein PAMA_006546 [Pampus argenteus]
MSALMEDIREAVLVVLPSLPEDKVQSLLNNLASIGVKSKSDLQFIKEEDLLANITPIQCRRLLNAWQTQDIKILEKMEQAVEEKGKLILRFFQQKTAGTSTDEVERILVKYNKEEKCDPCPCVILLLMAHFKEKYEGLILQADVFSTAADVEREQSRFLSLQDSLS